MVTAFRPCLLWVSLRKHLPLINFLVFSPNFTFSSLGIISGCDGEPFMMKYVFPFLIICEITVDLAFSSAIFQTLVQITRRTLRQKFLDPNFPLLSLFQSINLCLWNLCHSQDTLWRRSLGFPFKLVWIHMPWCSALVAHLGQLSPSTSWVLISNQVVKLLSSMELQWPPWIMLLNHDHFLLLSNPAQPLS